MAEAHGFSAARYKVRHACPDSIVNCFAGEGRKPANSTPAAPGV